ncbi:hypothetical protein HA466_0094460 [Hirschfeldia incana]|nr:hypothetical protein HA466_0094460 [Hirschfeldia incana]
MKPLYSSANPPHIFLPEMVKPSSSSSGGTNLYSCTVVTIFIIPAAIMAVVTIYLTVFGPRDPAVLRPTALSAPLTLNLLCHKP